MATGTQVLRIGKMQVLFGGRGSFTEWAITVLEGLYRYWWGLVSAQDCLHKLSLPICLT